MAAIQLLEQVTNEKCYSHCTVGLLNEGITNNEGCPYIHTSICSILDRKGNAGIYLP